jgi:hypothetical protein
MMPFKEYVFMDSHAGKNSTIVDPDSNIPTNVKNARTSRLRNSINDFFHVANPMSREVNSEEVRLVGLRKPSLGPIPLNQIDVLRL